MHIDRYDYFYSWTREHLEEHNENDNNNARPARPGRTPPDANGNSNPTRTRRKIAELEDQNRPLVLGHGVNKM